MFNLFNLSLKLNGFPMKEAIAEFEKIRANSDADYENYIHLKRREIVEYHFKNNKSYQEFVGKSEIQNCGGLNTFATTVLCSESLVLYMVAKRKSRTVVVLPSTWFYLPNTFTIMSRYYVIS